MAKRKPKDVFAASVKHPQESHALIGAVKKKQSRPRKRSDDIYNARRRLTRAAERYEKKARGATGATKARYEAMARQKTAQALLTYEKSPLGKTAKLAESLGVTREMAYAGVVAKGYKAGTRLSRSQITEVVGWSMDALAGRGKDRRDTMAKDLLNIDNIGSRFYGGLIDVWGKDQESRKHPNQAILDYFGASSVMDVLERLEAAGIDIYSPVANDATYKSIQLKIQEFILEGRR